MSAAPAPLVIDTNLALDLLVFQDARVAELRDALAADSVRWCVTPAMRAELERVLDYPRIAPRLIASALRADEVLSTFDRWTVVVGAPPPAPVRCRDPDDQIFIDLAVQLRARLLSKDACVLGLARRLAPLGVRVARGWTID